MMTFMASKLQLVDRLRVNLPIHAWHASRHTGTGTISPLSRTGCRLYCSRSPYLGSGDVLRMIDFSGLLPRPVTLLAVGAAILAMSGFPIRAVAQTSRAGVCGVPASDSSQLPDTRWSFGMWIAGGTHEPLKTREGHVEDRALYILGISASRHLASWRLGDLRYVPTLLPGLLATANREYNVVRFPGNGSALIPYKRSAFGVGVLPVAIEAVIPASDRAGLLIGGGGGAAYFDRRIPDPGETRFNFLADGHAGLYLHTPIGITTLGFRLQHISNGNTGRVNPGMDSRMLYVGFSR
jgi:lipid A 3-O-deacylase PagL